MTSETEFHMLLGLNFDSSCLASSSECSSQTFFLWIRPSLCEGMLLGKGCHFFFWVWIQVSLSEDILHGKIATFFCVGSRKFL